MTVMWNSSGRCFLVWLMMTTNHCQRTFQQKKNRMHPISHSSSQPGSIQAVAFTALKEDTRQRLTSISNTDVKPTMEQLFEMFFFKPFIMGTIIPQMNKCLQQDRHCHLTYGESLHWLGFWFLMATINGPDKVEVWSMGEVDYFVGAPMRLGSYMSRKHFESILKVLSITLQERPAFTDHVWEVFGILKAWNSNMVEQFTPSWVSCLDKSMDVCSSKTMAIW